MAIPTLLTLPAELRNQIYHHVFTSRDHLTQSIFKRRTALQTHALSLLLTCRQIHHEAALLAYSSTTFLTPFHRARTLEAALQTSGLPPTLRDSITSLTVSAHLGNPICHARPIALLLENMALLAPTLPALHDVTVLFEHLANLKPILAHSMLLPFLVRMLPSARFELETAWASVIEPLCTRERCVYLLRWKADSDAAERALRVEFLSIRPLKSNVYDADEAEVGAALAAASTPSSWELKRRERPFLTAGAQDPAERMGRHRRSLGSTGSASPESSPRSQRGWSFASPRSPHGFGSPRSSLGLGSPRLSLGGDSPSPRRWSVGIPSLSNEEGVD